MRSSCDDVVEVADASIGEKNASAGAIARGAASATAAGPSVDQFQAPSGFLTKRIRGRVTRTARTPNSRVVRKCHTDTFARTSSISSNDPSPNSGSSSTRMSRASTPNPPESESLSDPM